LFVAIPGFAERGITITENEPHFSSVQNQDTVEDIRVKVLGGEVRMSRVWKGEAWEWNERWNNLDLVKGSEQKDAAGDPLMIYRGGQLYRRMPQSGGKLVYENQQKNWITRTTTGYEWENRAGDKISFDQNGRMTGYADRQSVWVKLIRDESGNIQKIQDHLNQDVLIYHYENIPGAEAQVINGQSVF
jgi:hypothetical protein